MSNKKLCPSRNPSNSSLGNTARNDYECNIILCDENICLDAIESERRASQDAWKSHIQRIENLSKPRKKIENTILCDCCYDVNPIKAKKVSLEKLMPRINILSKPRRITPKYVRPPSEKLKSRKVDWCTHGKWLELRSKPKEFVPYNYCSICPNPKKLNQEGWQRLSELAQPKIRKAPMQRCRSIKLRRSSFTPTRIYELSKPKIKCCQQVFNANKLKVSTSAMTYQASERIKELALPKYYNNNMIMRENNCGGSENTCCHQSISCDNLFFKVCNKRRE